MKFGKEGFMSSFSFKFITGSYTIEFFPSNLVGKCSGQMAIIIFLFNLNTKMSDNFSGIPEWPLSNKVCCHFAWYYSDIYT